MRGRQWLWLLGFALVAFFGYWLAGTAVPEKTARENQTPRAAPPRGRALADDPAPKFRRAERPPARPGDPEAEMLGALEGQRVLVFKDQAALQRFMEKMGKGIRLLGRLDALNALRVGFSDYADLAALLDGDQELSFVFPISTPPLPDGSVQPGAMALGNQLLEWLGITGDNSKWGAGVLIAILDTGVAASWAFNTTITHINLVPLPADPSQQNGHGTMVASMIIGNDPLTPGVAPASPILSIRIADDNGQSNSYLLAQGIIAAVDAGAQMISVSMGGYGESALVEKAKQYALDRGVLIFAAPGNNGIDKVALPGGYAGVITPGAVDADHNVMNFSNTGREIDIAAPGYGINAAGPGEQVFSVTGTSFSTPIAVGVTAAIMTEKNLPAAEAWRQAVTYANDTGTAGWDPQSGAGTLDIGRVLNAGTPGIYDAAVASQRILSPDSANPYGQVEILIQNRGTENLINTAVRVSTGGSATTHNITTLAPNAVTTVSVPITRPPNAGTAQLQVDAGVSLSGGLIDAKPSNDRRIETYAPAGSP